MLTPFRVFAYKNTFVQQYSRILKCNIIVYNSNHSRAPNWSYQADREHSLHLYVHLKYTKHACTIVWNTPHVYGFCVSCVCKCVFCVCICLSSESRVNGHYLLWLFDKHPITWTLPTAMRDISTSATTMVTIHPSLSHPIFISHSLHLVLFHPVFLCLRLSFHECHTVSQPV